MFLLDALTMGAVICIGVRLLGVVGTPIVRAFRMVCPTKHERRAREWARITAKR